MSRYVDADLLKAEFTENFTKAYATPLIKAIIDSQPTADVEEIKHGKWIHHGDFAECSKCEHITNDYSYIDNDKVDFPHYCNNCGASMLEDK